MPRLIIKLLGHNTLGKNLKRMHFGPIFQQRISKIKFNRQSGLFENEIGSAVFPVQRSTNMSAVRMSKAQSLDYYVSILSFSSENFTGL